MKNCGELKLRLSFVTMRCNTFINRTFELMLNGFELMLNGLPYSTVNKSSMSKSMSTYSYSVRQLAFEIAAVRKFAYMYRDQLGCISSELERISRR